MILNHWHGPDWQFEPNKDYGEQSDGTELGPWRCDKPSGLWLSNDTHFGWKEWCDREEYGMADTESCTAFDVDESRILMLDTSSPEFGNIVSTMVRPHPPHPNYGSPLTDWRSVAGGWCGVYMDEGAHAAYFDLDMRLPHWVYGWDCASACVWDLGCIKPVETRNAA